MHICHNLTLNSIFYIFRALKFLHQEDSCKNTGILWYNVCTRIWYMVRHQSASTAVYSHIDDSPYTRYVNIHYTTIPVFSKLETCRSHCVKLNYIRCAFGWFYIVTTQTTVQSYALINRIVSVKHNFVYLLTFWHRSFTFKF
jgi:hypothetical protein